MQLLCFVKNYSISTKGITYLFMLVTIFNISSCENRNAREQEANDLEYKTDSVEVFSKDLSYYDPNEPEADYKSRFYLPWNLKKWYGSLLYKMNRSQKDSARYSILLSRLRQFPVYVEIPWGEKKELKSLTVPYGNYLDYLKTLPPEVENPCDKEAAKLVLQNMKELTSKIDQDGGKYYIIHDLWLSCDYEKRLKFITAVADAHACLGGNAKQITFIDDLTDSKIAEASPTWGIKVIDQ
jgi:hypothetical protein